MLGAHQQAPPLPLPPQSSSIDSGCGGKCGRPLWFLPPFGRISNHAVLRTIGDAVDRSESGYLRPNMRVLSSLGEKTSTLIYTFSCHCFRVIMSATTTTTATRGSLSVLADYEVHHSGSEQVNAPTTTSAHVEPASEWPSHWRRMPAYRPVNRQLDQNDRPAGNGHPAEYAFIQIMLHGCWINSVS